MGTFLRTYEKYEIFEKQICNFHLEKLQIFSENVFMFFFIVYADGCNQNMNKLF